jgi:hypothetical protein
MTVRATREGLVGKQTATGWVIDTETAFVALPSHRALHRFVKVTNPLNGKSVNAQVLDVGPWNEHDEAYVFGGARPAAEFGQSVSGNGTNGAGIDLGEYVWHALGMEGNTDVEWDFILQ